jgi:histidyl-tRNA synthetase
MKKQMSYANVQCVPYVALVGESEMQEGLVALKNMQTGEQRKLTIDEVVAYIKGE